MSSNSDPITIPHQPGKLDFQIVEKGVSVTQFRRKPSAVWTYLETAGCVIVFTRRGKRAYLRLTDGGEGMTPEVLTSAFSRYAQPQEQGDPRAGAGFSLLVVQAVIQAHGGTILLQSQKDAGTDVTLTLPVGLPQEQALLRSPRVTVDRSGGFVPELVELSDALPPEAYDVQNFL